MSLPPVMDAASALTTECRAQVRALNPRQRCGGALIVRLKRCTTHVMFGSPLCLSSFTRSICREIHSGSAALRIRFQFSVVVLVVRHTARCAVVSELVNGRVGPAAEGAVRGPAWHLRTSSTTSTPTDCKPLAPKTRESKRADSGQVHCPCHCRPTQLCLPRCSRPTRAGTWRQPSKSCRQSCPTCRGCVK